MTELRQLQRDLQRYLLSSQESVIDAAIDAAIVDQPPIAPSERLEIYRAGYRIRLVEGLRACYPILHRILGDEDFFAMGSAFIDANPSVHRSIRWYGRELGSMLTRLEPFADQPIFAELASFEWTLCAVFDSPDATPIERSALQAIDPASWSDLRFAMHPSVRRLAFTWNTVAVWQAMSRDEPPPEPQASSQRVPWLLWRQHLANYFRSLDEIESAAIEAVIDGATFGELCEILMQWVTEDQVPLRAAGFIAAWADSGIIVDVALGDPP